MHLVLVDLRDSEPELTGQQAEDRLHEIGITVNRNAVPFDPRPPMEASGLRIGTPALATRGLQREDFVEIGEIIAVALTPEFERARGELAERVARDRRALPAVRGPGRAHARARPRTRSARSRRRCAPAPPRACTPLAATSRRLRCCARVDGAPDRARRALRLPGRRRGDRAADAADDAPRARASARSTSRASAGCPIAPTPLLGGLAIFAGALVAGADLAARRLRLTNTELWHGVLLAAAVITLVGALDDRFDLPPAVKLARPGRRGGDRRALRRRGEGDHAAVRRHAARSPTRA